MVVVVVRNSLSPPSSFVWVAHWFGLSAADLVVLEVDRWWIGGLCHGGVGFDVGLRGCARV
ncbi:hypothetical protein BVRB_4g074260 [Beta vulgaris subsp. vulgaris]|nr:hypothetical protein BVRB_4g074260 [Beta vulgaris subsp. vulgaris]